MLQYNNQYMQQFFRDLNASKSRGFTLIELLVVIAIIGILSSVIFASLSIAREKSRDSKRVAEVGQVRKALEIYYDMNQTYPSTTPTGYTGEDAAIQLLAANGLLGHTPVPPPGISTTYLYRGVSINPLTGVRSECVTGPCNNFELAITLERDDNIVLASDLDLTTGTLYGANPNCADSTVGTDQCYDVGP
jgi:prepilin-type N-terminal cleavage/methylation domain-containing protein